MSASPRRARDRSASAPAGIGGGGAPPASSSSPVLGRDRGREQTQVAKRPGKRASDAATATPAGSDDRHDAESWLFRLEMVDCGKGDTGRCRKCASGPGHGPYWYRYRWADGKMHKRYVG